MRRHMKNALKVAAILITFIVAGGGAWWSEPVAQAKTRSISGYRNMGIRSADMGYFRASILSGFQEIIDAGLADLDDVEVNCTGLEGFRFPLRMITGINTSNVNTLDGINTDDEKAMLYNTWVLQNTISCAGEYTQIKIPAGTFYFLSGHLYINPDDVKSGIERHVISFYKGPNDEDGQRKQREIISHIAISGSDSDGNATKVGKSIMNNSGEEALSGQKTILKPYSSGEDEFFRNERISNDYINRTTGENAVKESSTQCTRGEGNTKEVSSYCAPGGLDMFFFNDLSAYGGKARYLDDVNFYDLTIDSDETAGYAYNTGGKGFMINIFEDCEWRNVVVKNTDGTGFGVDSPKGRSGIYDSLAVGNGKGVWNGTSAYDLEGVERGGGAGFGIGTGYENGESFEIHNSIAVGNGTFGFFYEHQGRFGSSYTGESGDNFSVTDSISMNNTWNYGGMRANDVKLEGDISESDNKCFDNSNNKKICTQRNVHFSDESRRVDVAGSGVDIGGTVYGDIGTDAYYYDAVLWLEQQGIAEDTVGFQAGELNADGSLNKGLTAVSQYNDNYVTSMRFEPNRTMTRADTVTLLWRMMGRPGEAMTYIEREKVGKYYYHSYELDTCFSDVSSGRAYAQAVKWALEDGVTNGTSGACAAGSDMNVKSGTFSPEREVTRSEFVAMLYRLWQSQGSPAAKQASGSAGESNWNGKFADVKERTDGNSWYYDAVYWAHENGITNGVGEGKFAPEARLTRAQIAAFLYRYWTQFMCSDSCPDVNVLLDVNHNKK